MILSAEEIKKAVAAGEITIDPFDPAMLKAASYTFTLGSTLRKLKPTEFIDPRLERQEFEEYEIGPEGYLLQPGEFVILQSHEALRLGPNIACMLAVRGSRAQEGLDPISSAIYCEPGSEGGFNGPLSLETKHNGPYPIKLFAGIKIVKGVFHRMQK